MDAWTSKELKKIGAAEELRIASLRSDGTLRKPVTIWVVCLGDDLYVRSVNGRTGAWFRGTQERHERRIWVGSLQQDVSFVEEAAPPLHDQIDAAYRTKYRRYAASIIGSVVSPSLDNTAWLNATFRDRTTAALRNNKQMNQFRSFICSQVHFSFPFPTLSLTISALRKQR